MKIGSVEGSPEEVHNLFQNNGLNLSEYLQPAPRLSIIWLIIPSILFIIFLSLLTLSEISTRKWELFIFLLGFSSSVWLGVSVHIRFENRWCACAIILAGLLIMLIAIGVLEPKELIDHYNKMSS
jgi:hypothetical protein